MYLENFNYSLVVRDIEPEEAAILMNLMKQEQYFDGALWSDYSKEDAQQKRIFFECGNKGSISKIERHEVEQTMHVLAMAFPSSRFYLSAENLDNTLEQYQICTHGDMFQSSELQTYMPKLSTPVPFNQRALSQMSVGARDYLNEFLHKTDFNLLYEQKTALLNLRETSAPLSTEALDGLVNFLDFIGDWAESEGLFTYPDFDREALVDSIMDFIKNELPDAGKISYPLADGSSFLNVSAEPMNSKEDVYALRLYQFQGTGFANTFSCFTEAGDFSALRKSCIRCLDFLEGRAAPEKPSLNNLISSAENRLSAPSSLHKESKGFDR